MSQETVSKEWLLTSPHRELTKKELYAIEYLKARAYDWIFAREGSSDDDTLHYHFWLQFPDFWANMFSVGRGKGYLPGWNVQLVAATDAAHDAVQEYCMKEGNYEHFRQRLPRAYAEDDVVWRPWQKKVLDMMDDPRKIICVVDARGNTGKTFLAMWHAVRHKAAILPLLSSYRDLMRCVYAIPSNIYFVDLPRALTKKQQKELFGALETVKNGYAFDDRYEFKRRYFDSPKVVVYTNNMPDLSLLSLDRWVFIEPNTIC